MPKQQDRQPTAPDQTILINPTITPKVCSGTITQNSDYFADAALNPKMHAHTRRVMYDSRRMSMFLAWPDDTCCSHTPKYHPGRSWHGGLPRAAAP